MVGASEMVLWEGSAMCMDNVMPSILTIMVSRLPGAFTLSSPNFLCSSLLQKSVYTPYYTNNTLNFPIGQMHG